MEIEILQKLGKVSPFCSYEEILYNHSFCLCENPNSYSLVDQNYSETLFTNTQSHRKEKSFYEEMYY